MMRLPELLLLVLLSACGGTSSKQGAAPSVVTTTQTSPRASAASDPSTPSSKCTLEKSVVGSLAAPMHITAYVTTGTPSLNAQVHAIQDVLERLKGAGAPHVDFAVVNYANPDGKDKARAAGMQPFDATDSRDGTAVAAVMGLTFEYRHESDRIVMVDPSYTSAVEYIVFKKLIELRKKSDGTKQRIGVLTGHGEIGLRDPNLLPATMHQRASVESVLTEHFPFLELVDVDLKKSAGAIDETLVGLVITQPKSDLPDEHLRRIDEFVTKGKTLVVVASAVNLQPGDSTMFATLSTHGIEKLLDGYGIEMRKDVVEDFGAPFKVPVVSDNGQSNISFPQFPRVGHDPHSSDSASRLDTSFPVFFSLPEIIFPHASSLVLHRDKQPGVPADGFRILARSTPSSVRETNDLSLAAVRQWRPRHPFVQYDLAASVEGNLTSAFAGGPPRASSRVLVLASSQLFANPFVYSSGATGDPMLDNLGGAYAQAHAPNLILAAKQTLDWVWMDRAFETCARASNPH